MISDNQPIADGLDSPIHGYDAAGALGGHIQVVGDGAGSHLEHIVGGTLVEENPAESWQECAGRTTLETAIYIVGHEKHHAKLFQGNELHIALFSSAHAQPFQQSFWIDNFHLELFYSLLEHPQ